jgi:hypothetical protein
VEADHLAVDVYVADERADEGLDGEVGDAGTEVALKEH